MFAPPAGDPTAATQAAERTRDLFLDLVARIVGPRSARDYGALLLTTAHGAAGFEGSGHFIWDKWQTNPEQLIETAIGLLPAEN